MTATMEHEDYLTYEDEHEDYLTYEDEDEHEDYLTYEGEQEDFLGDLLRSALGAEVSGPLNEHDETELAYQLMEVSSDEELDQFIGSVFKKVKDFAKSKVGQAVGGVLKGIAKKALPVVGGAVGSWVAPGIGTAIGSRLGSLAGGLLEMESELDEQELELEIAKRIVRIGATAAQNASQVSPRSAAPADIAHRAVIAATRKHAPSVLEALRQSRPYGRPQLPGRVKPSRPPWARDKEAFEGGQEGFLGDLLRSALGAEVSGPLNEHDETELASQLMEVGSDEELDQFIGDLFHKVVKVAKDFGRSGVGQAISGALKDAAKKALPAVGGAVGSWVAPGIGTAIGSRLGSLAGGLLEMESELDEQELEFEMAKRFVRIGATAAHHASRVPSRSAPPAHIARRALIAAVRRHAPAALTRGQGEESFSWFPKRLSDLVRYEGEQEDFLGDLLRNVLGAEVSGPFNEHDETELAYQLMEVGSEEELDQFIGSVFKKVKDFAKSKVGQAVGGALKGLAKKALPVVGGAVGSWVAPGIGTAIGSRLGSLAGGLLEMEGELDEQELEFEMAKRIVRIGATAAHHASRIPPRSAPPAHIARRALIAAVRRHAPAALDSERGRASRGTVAPPRFRARRPVMNGHGGTRPGRPRPTRRGAGGYPGYTTVINVDADQQPGVDVAGYDDQGYPADAGTAAGQHGAGRGVRRGRSAFPHNV